MASFGERALHSDLSKGFVLPGSASLDATASHPIPPQDAPLDPQNPGRMSQSVPCGKARPGLWSPRLGSWTLFAKTCSGGPWVSPDGCLPGGRN